MQMIDSGKNYINVEKTTLIIMNIRQKLVWKYESILKHHYPYLWSLRLYKKHFGRYPRYSNPKDINEKILWLMHYTNTDQWSVLADKYAVREYVKEKIGSQYLIPLLGKWNDANDIDFDKLPEQFVLKPNNGSYDCIICKDKSKLNINEVRQKLNHSMNNKFGYENAEPHYLKIKPCIIAEKLIVSKTDPEPVDYKIWCFNGEPYCFFICVNRNPQTHHAEFLYYDLEWKKHPDRMTKEFRVNTECPKPKNLEELLNVARKLSEGLPQVRIDLYNEDGKIYFGEMTLSSNFGTMPYFIQEELNNMGDKCQLSHRNVSEIVECFFKRWLPRFI